MLRISSFHTNLTSFYCYLESGGHAGVVPPQNDRFSISRFLPPPFFLSAHIDKSYKKERNMATVGYLFNIPSSRVRLVDCTRHVKCIFSDSRNSDVSHLCSSIRNISICRYPLSFFLFWEDNGLE